LCSVVVNVLDFIIVNIVGFKTPEEGVTPNIIIFCICRFSAKYPALRSTVVTQTDFVRVAYVGLVQKKYQYYFITSGAGTAYPFGAPAVTPWFLVGFVLLDL